MDIDSLLTTLFLIMPLVFAFICLYYAFYYLKNVRFMQDIPVSKIRSAAQGFVELNGTSKSLLRLPTLGALTQKPCAWYYYTIEWFGTRINQNQEAVSNWNVLERGISSDPFVLNDGTGECVILPQNAEIIPGDTIVWRGHKRIPAPPTTSFLRWLLWEDWGRYRYTEQRIELESPIYARGTFYTYSKENPAIQSQSALSDYCEEKNLTTINVLSKTNLARNESFIISATPQTRLIRQFSLKALVFFIAFVFFATLMVNNTYPVVKRALQSWNSRIHHTQQDL